VEEPVSVARDSVPVDSSASVEGLAVLKVPRSTDTSASEILIGVKGKEDSTDGVVVDAGISTETMSGSIISVVASVVDVSLAEVVEVTDVATPEMTAEVEVVGPTEFTATRS
jgi:hypothetical protein